MQQRLLSPMIHRVGRFLEERASSQEAVKGQKPWSVHSLPMMWQRDLIKDVGQALFSLGQMSGQVCRVREVVKRRTGGFVTRK